MTKMTDIMRMAAHHQSHVAEVQDLYQQWESNPDRDLHQDLTEKIEELRILAGELETLTHNWSAEIVDQLEEYSYE